MRLALLLLLGLSGCAGGDQLRVKESREAFLSRDYTKAEASLYTPEVLRRPEGRMQHFLMLSSIAFSSGEYEKAAFFLEKSRQISNDVRSDHGLFSWYDKAYGGNPIEYSYIHQYLILAYTLLADEGGVKAWQTPEMKDEKGRIVVQAETHPARKLSAREIADLRVKARAELLSWDTHLENLKRTYGHAEYYQEDAWARILAAYLHSRSSDSSERKTSEILLTQVGRILEREKSRVPAVASEGEAVQGLAQDLKKIAKEGVSGKDTFILVQGGVMNPYRKRTTLIGLSTLFSGIEDPGLRAELENIGFRVLLHYAPEFGLVAFTGAMMGAVSGGDDEDGPRHFTEAADRGLGFQVSFPELAKPVDGVRLTLELTDSSGATEELRIPVTSPLHSLLSVELKNRKKREFPGKAVKIGLQYLAILIPAVKAYQNAEGEGAGLKKLGILAGFFIAKKAIDAANEPDLRSWNTLPQIIASGLVRNKTGEFKIRLRVESSQGMTAIDLGTRSLPPPGSGILFHDLGSLPVLERSDQRRH